VVAELWGFESIKHFVLQGVGLAFVPHITAWQELRDHTLVQIPVEGLDIPRQTFIIYRDRRYLSDAARELLSLVVRHERAATPVGPREPEGARASRLTLYRQTTS
jgi:DNA-binding transcriptional LysR family regulator